MYVISIQILYNLILHIDISYFKRHFKHYYNSSNWITGCEIHYVYVCMYIGLVM